MIIHAIALFMKDTGILNISIVMTQTIADRWHYGVKMSYLYRPDALVQQGKLTWKKIIGDNGTPS